MPKVEGFTVANAPAALGPYSAVVRAGNTIHVSGQLPIVPETGEFAEGDIQAQARQSLTNVRACVEAAGGSMDNVAEVTVLLADINDFAAVNEVYAEFFTEPYPARAAYQVAALPKGAPIEIKAVAYVA